MARRASSTGVLGCLLFAPLAFPLLVVRWIVLPVWFWWSRVWDCRTPHPGALERTMRVRDVLAVVVVAGAHLIWRWGRIDVDAELNERIFDRVETLITLVLAVLLAGVVFVAIARPGARAETAALVAIPIGVVLSVAAVLAAAVLGTLPGGPLVVLTGWLDTTLAWSEGPDAVLGNVLFVCWQVVKYGGGFALAVAAATTMAAVLVMCVRSLFRARDAHPLMEPIVALALAASALVAGVLGGLTAADPAFPWWVAWCLTFAGPLLVSALSVAQLVLLREWEYRFRTPAHYAEHDPLSRTVLAAIRRVGGLHPRRQA